MELIITGMIALVVCLQVIYIPVTGSNNCRTNCKSPLSPHDEICDAVTGHCLHGCNSGFVGAQCTLPCGHGCHECHLKNESSAEIVCSECGEGFFKGDGGCFQCSDNCLQGCNLDNGTCNNGCKAGYYGPTCSQRCNELCKGRQCNYKTGSCDAGCTYLVLTGSNCSEVCSKGCKDRECYQTGNCRTKGCNPGYWGIGCRKTCGTGCNVPSDSTLAVCDEMSGSCLHGCNDVSFWGSHCNNVCEINCGLPNDKSQRICAEQTGTCLHGCKSASHVWGPNCKNQCEETCLTPPSTQKMCSEEKGECLHGCKPNTLWGPKCDRHCAKTCIDTVCHPDTGTCAHGCIDGHEGEKCDMKDFCWLTNVWAIVLFAALGLSFIVNIVLCICYNRVK